MGLPSSSRQPPPDPRRGSPVINETRYGTSMKFVIPSDYTRGREVQTRILDEVGKFKYNSDSLFAIKLSLEEAMVNAIKHGNKLDPNKKVFIEALVGPGQTEIIIEDEGPGFERVEVPDPTAPENLEKCSGRGILLIEAYMSAASWTHNGRRLHMVKRND
jgi:serine/threonine-protein kinase RsbW